MLAPRVFQIAFHFAWFFPLRLSTLRSYEFNTDYCQLGEVLADEVLLHWHENSKCVIADKPV